MNDKQKQQPLSKHGRTPEQIGEFYLETLIKNRKRFSLSKLPDKNYQPILECGCCGKESAHIPVGLKDYTLKWISNGNEMKTTGLKQNWRCVQCGNERAWGTA